jgi:hypothetical protein
MLRAFNNLTERLHASFFLYLLPEPFQFLSVATYLSAPILIAAALTIAGLRLWRRKTSTSDLQLVLQLVGSYIFGGILLWLDSKKVRLRLNEQFFSSQCLITCLPTVRLGVDQRCHGQYSGI